MGKKIVFLLASFFFVWVANGQNTIIKGIVTDSITGERLPYVSLKFEGTTIGAATDGDGNFSFSTPTIDKIYNPQNEMFRLLGTKRSFSQNETFFFSHP